MKQKYAILNKGGFCNSYKAEICNLQCWKSYLVQFLINQKSHLNVYKNTFCFVNIKSFFYKMYLFNIYNDWIMTVLFFL